MKPGDRVVVRRRPFKGLHGTVMHPVGHKWLVQLDQTVGGRNVLIWHARGFKPLEEVNQGGRHSQTEA